MIYYLANPTAIRLDLVPALEPVLKLSNHSKETFNERATALSPRGRKLAATISGTTDGIVAKIKGAGEAGLYRLTMSRRVRAAVPELLTRDGKLPFTMTRDGAESHMTALDDSDIGSVKKEVRLLEPDSVEQVLQILEGKPYGEELWRFFAIGAFVLLLCELALTRWIAATRKTGSHETVDFAAKKGYSPSFREQLARFKEEDTEA